MKIKINKQNWIHMTNITRTYFDQKATGWISESYDQGPTIAHTRLAEIVDIVKEYSPTSILDIGCGDGRFLAMLDFLKVRRGIDYSNRMIELATASGKEIAFSKVNLNSDQELSGLSDVGQYDFITMMGVIHYLSSPSKVTASLGACCNNQTYLAMSFRNRLMNSLEASRYYDSPTNKTNLLRLREEIAMWSRIDLKSSSTLYAEICKDVVGCKLIEEVINDVTYDGVTDNYWNPESFEHWRQFTPTDAVVLMDRSGFDAQRIVPLKTKSTNDKVEANDEVMTNSSSFIVVAKYRGDGLSKENTD